MAIRHQLAVYSPLSAGACISAAVSALPVAADPRPRLIELLRREFDADDVVLCGSGTQALQLAISSALDAAGKTSVALPAYSCFDVASAAVGADARIALYDVDPKTLSPDLDSLDRVLRNGARVCVVAPLYGLPVDWEGVSEIAARHGAILIEDAAQGQGASWRDRKLGTLAELSTVSFGRGKGWTGGNGGAVLLRRGAAGVSVARPDEASNELKNVVGLVAQWTLGRPSLYGIPRSIPSLELGVTVYHPPRRVSTISRSSAASVLSNHAAATAESASRRQRAKEMMDRMAGSTGLAPIAPRLDCTPGFLRLPALLDRSATESIDEVRRLGVERGYPAVLSELAPVASRIDGAERRWLGAIELAKKLVILPTHSRVKRSECERIVVFFE